MGLISLIETRSNSPADPHMWINTLLESVNYATKSGTVITPETSLRVSVVYACVSILAETIASIPLTVIRKLDSGSDVHKLYQDCSGSFGDNCGGQRLIRVSGFGRRADSEEDRCRLSKRG